MVTTGQFLERPTLIPVGEHVLEGLSHRGQKRPPLLILAPPPDEGGSMDHVVAAEVAWAAASRGFPTLRFNYRGVGGSQGTRPPRAELIVDAEAALRLLEENTGQVEVVVASIGGAASVALELLRRRATLTGLCLLAPRRLEPADLLQLRVPLMVVVPEDDPDNPRAALAAAVAEAGGELEVIAGADRTFNRNLPRVGHVAVKLLGAEPRELM